jgi:hypothetical protein
LPKEIAGLIPKAAVDISGDFTLGRQSGGGNLAASLPANHPCTASKTPGSITIDIDYYRDAKLANFANVWPGMEERYAARKKEAEEQVPDKKDNSRLIRAGPVKSEDGPGGKILYWDSLVDCSERKHQERPEVSLYAIAHKDDFFVTIQITGNLTWDEAKAFAIEVMTNTSNVDFSQLGKY